MIRAVAYTERGMALLLGITDGNVERLKEGLPIAVDLGATLIEAKNEFEDLNQGKLELFISYQPTHVEIVQEWLDAGLPIDPSMIEDAAKIDATL